MHPARPRCPQDEQRTLITFWSIIRSPLTIGGNLTRNDNWTTSLLTNREVIAVDQHSASSRPLITSNDTTVWTAEPEDGKGVYLAVFNRSDGELKIDLQWNEVGLVAGRPYLERDLWEQRDLGDATALKLTLRPHACILYRVTGEPAGELGTSHAASVF